MSRFLAAALSVECGETAAGRPEDGARCYSNCEIWNESGTMSLMVVGAALDFSSFFGKKSSLGS